ncbi:MAG TPA: hypothetical protein VG125_30535 [Pirellulales bacterium]|jgi:hypothetical protein|nr:hypothetical protein [Pirellulales bacterium]
MANQSDQDFLAAFMKTARHFTALTPHSRRDPKSFDFIERRAAEILNHPPIDLHHRVMEHMGELREEQGGAFGEHNSELLEELNDHPQARRVFYAVIAACHELSPELTQDETMHHSPRAEPPEERGLRSG